jgi:hypothetical protein
MVPALVLGFVLLAQATSSPIAIPSPTPLPAPTAAPSPSPLTLSTAAVDLNPAQQRVVSVSGATAPITASSERKLVSVAVAPNATSLTITASQATGSDVIHVVDASGAAADVAVRVAFNAGTIVPQATLKITGNPVDATWLAARIEAFVTGLTQSLPGTQVQIGQVPAPVTVPSPGAQNQVLIPVQISSPNGEYFDQSGTTVVTVANVGTDAFLPALLFYDDDPERMTADGLLYRGSVSNALPARLYYYHDDSSDPRRLAIVLSTDATAPTSVQLVDAWAGPNIDVMTVGNAVTRKFLLTKFRGEGVIVDLSQDVPYIVHDVALTNDQLAAGTVDLRVLSGGPVTVSVVAASPGVDPRSLLDGPILPGDGHHRTGVFQLTGFGNDALTYTAGAPGDAKIVIGDREPTPPSADPQATGHDYGDYGVLHEVTVTFANSMGAPETAYLYFRPLAGPARASFLVDGAPIDLGCMREPAPYEITAFTLPPGQTRAQLQTMTDGGSFYPVEIGVTATQPQPSAPPITAPDGCFPKPGASPSPAASP